VLVTNVIALPGTINSTPAYEKPAALAGSDSSLGFLGDVGRTYATNLIQMWAATNRHVGGLQSNSIKHHRDSLLRLVNHAQVAPWELKPKHVVAFFEHATQQRDGEPLAPSTVGGYCAGWRSFQNYMLEAEQANEILRTFQIRPGSFVTAENSIAVKRAKLNHLPKSWALNKKEIDAIDEQFCIAIRQAAAHRSKSLLPLQRDRVMFHIAIHFALRVSELITLQRSFFHGSHDPALARFDELGLLTVTGKNGHVGTVPMREKDIHQMLTWYLEHVRPRMLLRLHAPKDGACEYRPKDKDEPPRIIPIADLLFPSERGGVVDPNMFRRRLKEMAFNTGTLKHTLRPHGLRHTGCTLMVPIYSPEVAQKYMRHRHLNTTLGYYHPSVLNAGNEVNAPVSLFGDDEDDDED